MRAIRTGGYGKPTACRALRRRPGAFRGGGHDPSESRMRENRTSGLRAGTGHRTGAKAAGQRLLPAPTAGRASPRLYDSLLFPATESIAATWPDVNMLILQNRGLQPKGCASESKGRSNIAPPCKFLGISRLKASPLPPPHQLQPLVEPQVLHFIHVPLRTSVKWPHESHGSPS